MPDIEPSRVLRLSLDINVFAADRIARDRRRRGTACSMLVEAVRAGYCPTGPVQLITSVPLIENWADVLRRKFGYSPDAAQELAWILQAYAEEGPLGFGAQVVVGSGHIPFETEEQMRKAVETHAGPRNKGKLFNEMEDDRHVLLSALAGRAEILATSDLDDFQRGPSMLMERDDVTLFPNGDAPLVIAKPSFVAFWLRQGVIPDYAFMRGRPDEFVFKEKAEAVLAKLTRA